MTKAPGTHPSRAHVSRARNACPAAPLAPSSEGHRSPGRTPSGPPPMAIETLFLQGKYRQVDLWPSRSIYESIDRLTSLPATIRVDDRR